MQIHPIRTEEDHRAAVLRIEKLMGAAPNSPEEDELDLLLTLVDSFEARHHQIDAPDPITAIEFRMEQMGFNRKDLEASLGTRARVSEVLNGKRALTLDMIRKLKDNLGMSADSLIGHTYLRRKQPIPTIPAPLIMKSNLKMVASAAKYCKSASHGAKDTRKRMAHKKSK